MIKIVNKKNLYFLGNRVKIFSNMNMKIWRKLCVHKSYGSLHTLSGFHKCLKQINMVKNQR